MFVGFATVPGFVSLTSTEGSPYLQALASQLAEHHDTTDLADIHLLVKRQLAAMKIGDSGVCQGAEERSSLLCKLLFSRYHRPGHCREGNSKGGTNKSPFSFFSLPGSRASSRSSSRSSSPMPLRKNKLLSQQDKPRPLSAVFGSSSLAQFLPSQRLKSSPALSSSLCRSLSSPSSSFSPVKSPQQSQHSQLTTHIVEVRSSDVERGLTELLAKVKEVYGGEGKVKVKRKNKNSLYSFKYGGPEKGARLLESAISNVKELQSKSELWKFTQRLEVTSLSNLDEISAKC